MQKQLFNTEWYFWEDVDSFALVWDIPDFAHKVTLPHDAMMEKAPKPDSQNGGNTGFHDGGNYIYLKKFNVTEEELKQKRILKFEGSYMNTFVYVNGQLAGKHHYGYTTFYIPIHDFLHKGENEIRVQVRNGAMTNSRWYSGGGLYRDVYLLTSPSLHFSPQGTKIRTIESDNEIAIVEFKVPIGNESRTSKNCNVKLEITDSGGAIVQSEERSYFVKEGLEEQYVVRLGIVNPRPWSADEPNLYHAKLTLLDNEVELDADYQSFGIRTISVDSSRGLRMNGQYIKLRGACIHHDSGLLGAETYEAVHRRQISILKEAGFNAIRMAHHPAAPALLRVCDELGMYVMDETFDMWTRFKSNFDYSMFFEESWRKDVKAMVDEDYNHPSVILYSIGNEIPEIATPHGSHLAHSIHTHIKSMDFTRPTLAGINGVFASGESIGQIMEDVVAESIRQGGKIEGNVNNFMTLLDSHLDQIVTHPIVGRNLEIATASTDIAGYNYMTARYEKDTNAYPNRVIVGSETYPPEIAHNWELVKKLPAVIGDFTWTGWDYIGEAGVGVPAYQWGEGGFGAQFPCQLAYAGDIDITGFRRPLSYYREIVFGLREAPFIAVQNPHHYGEKLIKTPWVLSDVVSTWTWSGVEGQPVVVEVYAAGDEVELYLDDVLLERKEIGEQLGFLARFETIYTPGELKAINYKNGQKLGEMTLLTATTKSARLNTAIEKVGDLSYITLTLADGDGNIITDSDCLLSIELEGAILKGLGSGNPKPNEHYRDSQVETFNGRALAIIKKETQTACLKVTYEQETRVLDF